MKHRKMKKNDLFLRCLISSRRALDSLVMKRERVTRKVAPDHPCDAVLTMNEL